MTTATKDYRAIWDDLGIGYEAVLACPVCNCDESWGEDAPQVDRYGFDCLPEECADCGLTYFAERMPAEAYAHFYQSGAYRRLVSAYHGREMGGCERGYAASVTRFMGIHDGVLDAVSLLDIGGAPDGVFQALHTTVIDPAIDGQTAETFDPAGRQWDLITVCQTVDHLLEPGAVFKKLAGCLAPNGVLFFDAVDFDSTKEYKIDHPCNFNMRSATMLAHVAGLRIDKMERSGNHLRFLCRHW